MRKLDPVEQVAQSIYRKGKWATSIREVQNTFIEQHLAFNDDVVEAAIKRLIDLANTEKKPKST